MTHQRERYKLPIAVFMLLKKGNQMLMIQRATTGRMDGYRSVPAGSLDPDEEMKSAAIRECFEEVGVQVDIDHCFLIHTQQCKVDQNQWINVFFMAEKRNGEPTVCEPHKHSEVKWCTVDDLPDNTIPYVRKAIDDIMKHNLNYGAFGWD